ncbi:MAG: hypothetical protein GC180_11455 [Bacteroidetes bacterium]|nr:hypothetical protein [Bacteroidota bacterium]
MRRPLLLTLGILLCSTLSALNISLVGSSSTLTDNNTTFSLSKPSGTNAGDLILIQAVYTVSTGAITAPTGFSTYVNTGSNAFSYALFYRFADGTEGSTFDVTSNSTRDWIGAVAVYRNVNPGAPFEDINYTFNAMANGATSFDAPAISSSSGTGVHVVFGAAKHTGTPSSISAPSGMTGITDTLGTGRMAMVAEQDIQSTGSTGAKTFTFSGAQGGGSDNNRRYFTVSLILRPLTILYTYQSGNFDSTTTWTTDPSVSTLSPSGGLAPLTGDSLVIKNGRTITLSADKSNTSFGLLLEEGSVLDLQTYTLDGLNSISGSGKLRSSGSSGSVAYFPTAQSNADFLDSGGGILEYYCSTSVMLNTSVTNCQELILRRESSGTTQYTLASNLSIYGDLTITGSNSGVARLTIGNNTTARSLSIGGTASVSSGCEWTVGTSNANHTVFIGANFSNYGMVGFTNQTSPSYGTASTTGTVTLTFTGAANNSFYCYGPTNLYRMIVDKGSDQTHVLSVESDDSTHLKLFGPNDQGNNPSSDPNPTVLKALSLVNGTLKLNSNIYLPCLTTGGDDFFIPQNAALWVNGAYIVSTTGSGSNTGITVVGKLRLSSGSIETGSSTGLLYRVNGEIVVEGGTLHAAQFREADPGTPHNGSYTQSGGTVTIDGTTEDNGHARFSLPNTGCTFDMSAGTLQIKYPVTRQGTAVNLINIGAASQNFSVTGGEIQAVSNKTGVAARMIISGTLSTLTLSKSGGGDFIADAALATSTSLHMEQGSPLLDMNGYGLSLSGDLEIDSAATLKMNSGTLSFSGATKSLFTVNGTLSGNLQDFYINKSDSLELAGSTDTLIVLGTFSLVDGVLADGGKTLDLRGNLVLSGEHSGTGQLLLSTATSRTVSGSGNGIVTNLSFDAPSDASATLSCNLKLQGELNFIGSTRRVLDFGAYALTIDSFASIINPGSNRFVRFNGLQSAGGMTKIYTSDSFYFPIGSGTGTTFDYTPSVIYFTSSPSTRGNITVKPVASENIAVTTTGRSLTYYWKTSSTGFTLGSAVVVQNYYYTSGDVVTGTGITEGGYVPAKFDIGAGAWVTGTTSDVDTITKRIQFTGASFSGIDGDYTAGDNSPVNPFGAVTIYYSRVDNGSWSDVNTWTTNSDHSTVSPPSTAPNANSIIRIGNGTSVFHTINIDSSNRAAGSLVIYPGSVLDLKQTTGNDFGVVGGTSLGGHGRIRMDRNGTSYAFPGGDYGNFLESGAGEIEYYNSTTSIVTLPTGISAYNKLIINAESTGIIEFPALDITIYDSLLFTSSSSGIVYINETNSSLGDLDVQGATIVSGGTVELRNSGNSATRNLTFEGDFQVDSGAVFQVEAGGTNLVHTMNFAGSLTNNGTFDAYYNDNHYIILQFTGADTSYFTGTQSSATTDIFELKLNKGSDYSSMLVMDVAGTLTTKTSGWLTLQNGMFRFAKSGGSLTVSDANATFSIPATCALSINHSTASMTVVKNNNNGADLLLTGKLEVMNGTMYIGNTADNKNNDIIYTSTGVPKLILSGGTLNVAGQIRRSTSATTGSLYYNQSGSSIVKIFGLNNDNTQGMLEVLNSGSYFGMHGTSKLYIAGGGSSSFSDLYLNPTTYSVDGGTVYFSPLSPVGTSQTYTCNSQAPLYNLEITPMGALTASLTLNSHSLTLGNNLLISSSASLNTNSLGLTIGGRFTKSGTYTTGTSTVKFTGSSSALEGDFSSTAIYHLKVDTNAVLSLSGASTSVKVSSTLTIYPGAILNDSSHLLNITGNMVNYGQHKSLTNSSSNTLQFGGTSTQTITGTGSFGNLVVNNGNSVSMSSAMQINNQLTLSNGILDIGSNQLTLNTSATVSGTFNTSNNIKCNGVLSDGGIKKLCSSGANNVLFPVGLTGKYTPARINITSSNASGTITLKVINAKHPSTRLSADSQLNLYWKVDTTGFDSLTVTHTYQYVTADVTGSESDYVTGRFVSPSWTPLYGISGTVDTSANTATLSGVSYINGSFTLGNPNEFGLGSTYYSRKSSGYWDDLDMWSTTGHTGAPLDTITDLPNGSPVIIATGDTVTISGNSKLAESITLDSGAVLDLGNTFGHNLGTVSGEGKLRIKATTNNQFIFPAGTFTSFTGSSGGIIEYYGSTNGVLPTQSSYHDILFSDGATRTIPNTNLDINGDIQIDAGVVSNSTYNKTLNVYGDWVNNVGGSGFVPGTGTVNFASDTAQSISGITRFNTLEFSGGGDKTLQDSISFGNQLVLTGGIVYLGSHNLMADSAATSSGSPSASAMIVQNGSGRVVKRYISTSPAFVFPLGEETGTTEYSPVTLSFNSGTFGSLAIVSVTLKDSASTVCAGGNHYISRYWTFSSSGITSFSANITAQYVQADVVGTESNIAARMSRPSQTCLNGSYVNTSANTMSITCAVLNTLTGGEPPAAQPTVQPSDLFFTQIGSGSMTLTWTQGNGHGRIVFVRSGAAVDAKPVDYTEYTADTNLSGSPQNLNNSYVVYQGADSSFTLSGLSPASYYYFAIYEYTNQGTERDYLLTDSLTGSMNTNAAEPSSAATALTFDRIQHNSIRLNVSGGSGSKRIIVARKSSAVTAAPVDRQVYTASSTMGSGDDLGNSQYVVYSGAGDSVTVRGLDQNVYYHFTVFESNGSDTTTNYLTSSTLADSQHTYLLLEVTVFLEGGYANGALSTTLQSYIPAAQPYTVPPFNYTDVGSIQSVPTDSLVDWVMLELRNADTASNATSSTIQGRAVGFIRPDGTVDDTIAAPGVVVRTTAPGNFFVVVHHRTHISVMSSSHLTAPDTVNQFYSYDFTDAVSKAYGTDALISLGNGKWGMYSGSAENSASSEKIDANDRQAVWNARNQSGYNETDVNLDGYVNSADRSICWNNRNIVSQVPQ